MLKAPKRGLDIAVDTIGFTLCKMLRGVTYLENCLLAAKAVLMFCFLRRLVNIMMFVYADLIYG